MVSNPAFTRTNAWNNGGNFNNPDLLWYARGVGVMQSRALNDPNSWWFFAAIHGEYVTETGYPGWGSIPTPLRCQLHRFHLRAFWTASGISVSTKAGTSLHGIVDIWWHWKRRSGRRW